MVYVVAEIGVNWDGNPDLAENMMKQAKNCGCDAVKFQAFNENIIKNHPEGSRLIKSAISKKNIEKINDLAQNVGIEWFCTPMYPEAIDFLKDFITKFKIRYNDSKILFENKTSRLIDRVLEEGKDVIISTQSNPKNTSYYKNSKISWLYCVPKYPCDFKDLDFSNLSDFDGFSNHCPYIIAPLTAAILGSTIIEVHITSNKTKNFVDNPVSFDYIELSELVKLIRSSEKIKK